MKRDGRTLDHATLESIRKMAVQRVREGERPSDVIAGFGMHRCTIYGWLKAARGRGRGLKALAAKPASGRPRSLTARQEHQVFRWINGKNPMQYGFDFGLWTRQIAGDLIAQRFGVTLSLASVGALLARVGLTPQKPLQRAYFWDESGFRADAVQGTTWGAKGQTPVVSVPGQRQGISAASAVSAKGAFWFATYAGGLNGTLFVTLLRRMMRGRRKPLHLIVDGLPAHRTRLVRDYVNKLNGKLTLHFLPGYAPDLNPDELVWSHAKRTGNARRPLLKGERLEQRVAAQLADIGKRPSLVRSFFRHPSVAYIADC
jgi:transposase